MKLTRKQIKEGLEATPIDTLLLGSPKTLTAKQKEFAKQVAMGKPKAEAYRSAYDTNTTANAQRVEAHRLSLNPNISLMIEAIKTGLEANKYLLPSHLRALTIQKLTEKALDPDVNHAQQIKALELLGKITEVSLFTERKEITATDTSAKAKDKLIASLAHAIRSSANISEAKKKDADTLLAEITGGSLVNPNPETIEQASEDTEAPIDNQEAPSISGDNPSASVVYDDPLCPTPQNNLNFQATLLHSIPDKQSAPITETPPLSFTNTEWEGVDNFWDTFEKAPTAEHPPTDLGSHTPTEDINE